MASPLIPPYVTHSGNYPLYLNNNPVVQSLQSITGLITLTSPDSSVSINPVGQTIQLQAAAAASGVSSLAGGGTPLTGAVTIDAGTGITVSQVTPQTITIENAGVTALNNLNSGITLTSPDASITITPVGQDIQLQANIPAPAAVKQATYYKTAAQNLTSGNTDITFDATGSWNNDGGYITHTNGTTDFTVVQTGLYQLGFNATILVNTATWATTTNRNIGIDITRSPTAEQAVIQNSALQGVQNYTQSTSGYYYLLAGDVINLRVGNTFTGGPPQAQGIANTFDLNTFFTWTFIS